MSAAGAATEERACGKSRESAGGRDIVHTQSRNGSAIPCGSHGGGPGVKHLLDDISPTSGSHQSAKSADGPPRKSAPRSFRLTDTTREAPAVFSLSASPTVGARSAAAVVPFLSPHTGQAGSSTPSCSRPPCQK